MSEKDGTVMALTYMASDGERVPHFQHAPRTVLTNLGLDWVWDDARLPDWWWKELDRQGGEHWLPVTKVGYYMHAFLVRRLLDVAWRDVLAVTPTCGVEKCVNPSHLWVTLKTEVGR